jgi:mono/diheme cytochrome c family protein
MVNQQKRARISTILMVAIGLAMSFANHGQAQENFSQQQIQAGSELYARHCSPCHGVRMKNPEGAFDLLTFPPDQRARFETSVSKGKNSMPPWGGLLYA